MWMWLFSRGVVVVRSMNCTNHTHTMTMMSYGMMSKMEVSKMSKTERKGRGGMRD